MTQRKLSGDPSGDIAARSRNCRLASRFLQLGGDVEERRVHIDAGDMLAFADGEPLARLPLEVTVHPAGLSVLVHPSDAARDGQVPRSDLP